MDTVKSIKHDEIKKITYSEYIKIIDNLNNVFGVS